MSEGTATRRYPRSGDGIHVVSTTDLPSDQQVSTISTVSTIGWLEVIEIENYIYRKEVPQMVDLVDFVDTSRSEASFGPESVGTWTRYPRNLTGRVRP